MMQGDFLQSARFQRKLTVAVITVLLLGTLTAVAAYQRRTLTVENPSAAASSLSGMTILLDPGHGGYDGGARARDSGVWEKELNLAVALHAEKALLRRGATVYMTRRTDVDLCEATRPASLTKKRQDMENRIALASAHQADMVLSIHMNEYRSRSSSGPQVFYRKASEAGRLLAGCMQQALIDGLSPAKARTAMAGDYFILGLEVPSVLIECGFLSNASEEKKLLTSSYQQLIGESIASGVEEYVTLSRRLSGTTPQTPPAPAR